MGGWTLEIQIQLKENKHTTFPADPGKHCPEHQCMLSAASSATPPAPSSQAHQ